MDLSGRTAEPVLHLSVAVCTHTILPVERPAERMLAAASSDRKQSQTDAT